LWYSLTSNNLTIQDRATWLLAMADELEVAGIYRIGDIAIDLEWPLKVIIGTTNIFRFIISKIRHNRYELDYNNRPS